MQNQMLVQSVMRGAFQQNDAQQNQQLINARLKTIFQDEEKFCYTAVCSVCLLEVLVLLILNFI